MMLSSGTKIWLSLGSILRSVNFRRYSLIEISEAKAKLADMQFSFHVGQIYKNIIT
jgi:hypothetical protein